MALTPLVGMTPRTQRTKTFCDSGLTLGPENSDLAHLKHDPALMSKIMAKRQRDEERKSRMYSPRLARIGLDVAGLNAQVAWKQAQKAEEASHERFYADQAKLVQAVIGRKEEYMAQVEKDNRMACVDYNMTHLRKENRREYFLNDPQELKKDTVPGKDSSVSSMQFFKCEDTGSPEALWQKKLQQREWLQMQMQEKQLTKAYDKETEKMDGKVILMANEVRELSEHVQQVEHKAEIAAVQEENFRLAAARQARELDRRQRDQIDKELHIKKVTAHNLERATHDHSISSTGKKFDYKRCTLEQEQAVWDHNACLVLDKIGEGFYEAEKGRAYMRLGNITEGVLDARQEYDDNRRTARLMKLTAENHELARQKREAQHSERLKYHSYEPHD